VDWDAFQLMRSVDTSMTIELTVAELAHASELNLQHRIALRIGIRGPKRPAVVGESVYLTYAG
jgi:hypothetical protein